MKKFVSLIILTLLIYGVKAQQDPQFSMNMFNTLSVNPAVAGVQQSICATALNRQQWVGMENAPVTTVFNLDTPIKLGSKYHGIGLTIISDKLGFEKNNSIRFSYSFRKNIGNGTLNAGVSAGFQNNALKGQWYVPSGDNFTDPGSDPLLGAGSVDESNLVFDSGLGLFYHDSRLYAGISVTHLNQPKIEYGTNTKIFLGRHYYLMGGYTLDLSPSFELLPSLHYKTDGKASQLDINSNLLYNKTFWGGVSYRIDDAIIALAGVQLKNGLRIGYSYDISTSRIAKASHEFLVSYCFTTKLDTRDQTYKSIRFL